MVVISILTLSYHQKRIYWNLGPMMKGFQAPKLTVRKIAKKQISCTITKCKGSAISVEEKKMLELRNWVHANMYAPPWNKVDQ